MFDPGEDPNSRTGELPKVPTEMEMPVDIPLQPLTDSQVPDFRSATGIYRINTETRDDAPRDIDKHTPQKDSPA